MSQMSLRRIMILALSALPFLVFAILFSPVLGSVASAAGASILEGPRHLLPSLLLFPEGPGYPLGLALRASALPNPQYAALLVLDAKGRILAAWPGDEGLVGRQYSTNAPSSPVRHLFPGLSRQA